MELGCQLVGGDCIGCRGCGLDTAQQGVIDDSVLQCIVDAYGSLHLTIQTPRSSYSPHVKTLWVLM